MENRLREEKWLEQARRFVESAKNIQNRFPEISYYLALHAGELALKSVLVKEGCFDEEKDKTHNMLKLLQKIEEHECLPKSKIEELKEVVKPERIERGLSHVDVSAPQGEHINSEAGMTSEVRYPIGNSAPYEYIFPSESQEKVELADKLIKILSSR